MSNNLPGEEQSKVKRLPDSLNFEKREGTSDFGKLFEDNLLAFVILKLLQNKDVKDFRISANDNQFGAFDDFILEIEYTNKPAEKYAVQLKHKDKDYITINHFKSKKNVFYLWKYYETFEKCTLLSNHDLILFTNAKFKVDDKKNIIDLDGEQGEKVKVRIIKCSTSSIVNTSEKGKSYQFQLDPDQSEEIKEKYKNFFQKFFLYTNQMSARQLGNQIQQLVRMLTSKDYVSDQFLKFISNWSIEDGIKNKLTKDMILKVLTLRIVEGLIYSHSFGEVEDKKKIVFEIVQKAISHFNITTFNTTSLEQVVKIWSDGKRLLRDYDIKRIKEILKQFQIVARYIENIDELTEKESTKLLWVMDQCPLILKDGPATYEAVKLCDEKSNFVIITEDLHDKELERLAVFKELSDLKRHKSTYNDIVKNFTFNLFGEKTSFEKLIEENDNFENVITTNLIAQITDTTMNIVKLEEEKLCFPYVERYLYKNTIDFKYLQKLDEKTTVLISNVSDVKKLRDGLQNFEIVSIIDDLHQDRNKRNNRQKFQIINDTISKKYEQYSNRTKTEEATDSQFECIPQNFENKLLNDTNITKDKKINQEDFLTKRKLVFNQTETSPEEFTSLCDANKEYHRFHHLRYHDKYLEWIQSTADVSDLQNFITSSDSFVNHEKKYAENISHNVNIVVGDPGMGKSLFLKKLKNSLLFKYLPVLILPTDVPQLCQSMEHSKNLQKFFDFILETKFLKCENFERQVVKLLMQKGKVVFLWDALDELSEQNRKFVEEFIKSLSEKSIVQFITSRGFIRKQLEDKFKVLSQELCPFNDKQQTDYIQRRLQGICSGEELESIITGIKDNIANTYRDILGIPLQIHMLTELFLQDLPKYKEMITDFFAITDLYLYFIEEKFNFYYKGKRSYYNYKEDKLINDGLTRRIKSYQQVALQLLFGTAFLLESDKESGLFLNKIKEEGDEFGLITAVDMSMNPEFLHNSYAEYFAANYLAENCRSITNLDLIFDRKYMNVKYFFDSLLAKNSPVHIAVLCKNLKYFQKCSNTDELKTKDLQGRNALHLAASWGERYPLLHKEYIRKYIILDFAIRINDINYETEEENRKYLEILEVLLENCDSNEVDELFHFTPTTYAEKCECLFAAATIENKIENKRYLETKNETFIYSLLYYAIKWKFINIVNLPVSLKFIITKDGNSFVHMAVANNQFELLRELLKHDAYRRNINHRNSLGETALFTAALNGYTKIVKYLKGENAKVDATDNAGLTPLMMAALNGHLDTVKYLIQQNANVNAIANHGYTPLFLAAFNGHFEIVKYLKQHDAKVDEATKNGFTPLMLAAQNGHLDMVKYLIHQNVNVNSAPNKEQTAPSPAASKGHLETFKYLKQQNTNVDEANKNGFTPLMLAAQNGHLNTMKYLIQQNANINAANYEGKTPLYLATLKGHLETVKYLKKQNAKVDATDNAGLTPLMVVALNGHLDTVKYLIQQDANVNAAANEGQTPLHLAALKGHLDTVKYLIQQNANVNAVANHGYTSLFLAAFNGHLETVKYLKQHNAKVDEATKDGFTPLMMAAENGHIDTVKYLIQQNANVNAVANHGYTPLFLAAFNGHLETVKYLTQHNAKVDEATENGFTPLIVAAQNRHLDTVKYLIQQNANVNAATNQRKTAFFFATCIGHFETMEYLKQQNAKIDEATKNGFTPLMVAAENGHLDTVKYLIQQNANVNAVANHGYTPLFLAAFNGHLETVKYLKQQNAKIDEATKNGFTPLMVAAQNGHLDTVKYLIQQNANVNTAANKGQTPLYLAALNGHLETVRYLKQQNAKVDEADEDGLTPLIVAAQNGHVDTVKYLIQQNANVNAATNQRETALFFATCIGHLETIQYLKQHNATVDEATKNGFTPLIVAAQNGHLDTVKYLIQQNANVNTAANERQTALHLAVQNGHINTVKYLIQQNANVNAAANRGMTPLYVAALEGHLETAKYLKEQNAKVDEADKDGFTLLMWAVQNGHLDTVKYLIQQNANVNATANEGQTPLYLAAWYGHLEIVKFLKQQNAKVDEADKDGFTPLMRAAENGHLHIVKYLIEQNANVNAAANEGQTPLSLATLKGHLETVEYLISM